MQNDIREIRIDLVWEVVFADSVRLDYRWLKILALTMKWQDFKNVMCRTTGMMKAMVIKDGGEVVRYSSYDGFQTETRW